MTEDPNSDNLAKQDIILILSFEFSPHVSKVHYHLMKRLKIYSGDESKVSIYCFLKLFLDTVLFSCSSYSY